MKTETKKKLTCKECFELFKDYEILGIVGKDKNGHSAILIQTDCYIDFLINALFPYIKNDILDNSDLKEKITRVFLGVFDLKNIREYSNNK